MIEPIMVYSVAITIILIVCLIYLFRGVVTEEKKEHILLQSYDSYGKTEKIKNLPFHEIKIIKRTRVISRFDRQPKEEITYIIEARPMSRTNCIFKIK